MFDHTPYPLQTSLRLTRAVHTIRTASRAQSWIGGWRVEAG